MVSPKQSPTSRTREWYPYYAGFKEAFVAHELSVSLGDPYYVVDPWSGSGTTTAACIKREGMSVGVDVNPALTIIARARITPKSTADSLLPLGRQILEVATSLVTEPREHDPLLQWLRRDSVCRLRAVQAAIHHGLANAELEVDPDIPSQSDTLPLLVCFFYAVLFATTRDLMARFTSTNPTWFTTPASARHRIAPGWSMIENAFLMRSADFRDRLSVSDSCSARNPKAFITGTARRLPFLDNVFDAAFTSPPYATRIDYVKATLPELAVLGISAEGIRNLRESFTGTPVVRDLGRVDVDELHSRYGRSVLRFVAGHNSKGSRSYYLPWMEKYLIDLQSGLAETLRVLRRGAPMGVVIQDSYYKERKIDLQRFVIESMVELGASPVKRKDYAAILLRSRMNPRARAHAPIRSNTESLLVFAKH